MSIKLTSLQQRTLLYTILPIFIFLLLLSFIGFIFVRDLLITQWGETAISRLERSADLIEAKLREPKKLLLLLQDDDKMAVNRRLINHIATQIEELEMVSEVIVDWPDSSLETGSYEIPAKNEGAGSRRGFHLQRFDIGSPRYNNRLNHQTVSLVSEFKGIHSELVGTIEVIISFDTLLDHVINASWWKTNKAYLLDGSNNVLITTGDKSDLEDNYPMRRFGTVNQLEKDTLEAILEMNSGTILGSGQPPDEISGFYRLKQVPWTLVVTAPGETVLEPIIAFRHYYVISLAISIGLILLIIRFSMNRVTEGIKRVSQASNELANGNFGPPLTVVTRDEVGELTENFNKMSRQLQQRLELKKNIGLAREVQQGLLPLTGLSLNGIEMSGKTLYCDETGGDYFDILKSDDHEKVAVVVGDVVGHGVGAALLMATVRALLRSSFNQSETPAETIQNVNTLLNKDTETSGSFVTLFYLEVEPSSKTVRWIRAGHDPALIINRTSGEISELKGEGIALGVDPSWRYECAEFALASEPQVILICSDGVFEAVNGAGEHFGKQRVHELLTSIVDMPTETAVDHIMREIEFFTRGTTLEDDITVAVFRSA